MVDAHGMRQSAQGLRGKSFVLVLLALLLPRVLPSPARFLTTVVGPPEVVAGPTCCLFDSPFLSLRTSSGEVLGYSANAVSDLFSAGASIDALLPSPLPTGLHADAAATSYSHCGKWLNAAFAEPNTSTVHAYFHQEWQCDYAHDLYTNKSIGYAVSQDGGRTFTPSTAQIIAGKNFSASTERKSECGEGDHGVVALGEYLYLFFIEWDAPTDQHGGMSVGVARSRLVDAGIPGSWKKLLNGDFTSDGVGGDASSIR